MRENLNAILQKKGKDLRDFFPFIPEESGSDSVAVQKLTFYLIMVFQKRHESQVMNLVMVSSVQKQV